MNVVVAQCVWLITLLHNFVTIVTRLTLISVLRWSPVRCVFGTLAGWVRVRHVGRQGVWCKVWGSCTLNGSLLALCASLRHQRVWVWVIMPKGCFVTVTLCCCVTTCLVVITHVIACLI